MRWITISALLLAWGQTVAAQVPEVIRYQGRLVQGTNLVQGSVGLSLRLYDAPTGGTLRYEDSNTVTVVDGLYATGIGDTTTLGNLVSSLNNQTLYLETVVDGVPLAPREELASVAYALVTRGMTFTTNSTVILNPTENNADASVIGASLLGGTGNVILDQSHQALIGAGLVNSIEPSAPRSLIGAGINNRISSGNTHASIVGGADNLLLPGSSEAFIGGGEFNIIEGAEQGVIVGGTANRIFSGAYDASIGGGRLNLIGTNSFTAAVAGGWGNEIDADASGSFIGAGGFNRIDEGAFNAAIVSGRENVLQPGAARAFIGAGRGNQIDHVAFDSVIGGGVHNRIGTNAPAAVIPGGESNTVAAGASHAFAAGYRANANHSGSFVWADRQEADFASTAPNQFAVRALGGIRLDGLVQLGSGNAGIRPLVVRRVESTVKTNGAVVARTDEVRLVRDGSSGGFLIIVEPAVVGNQEVAAFGVDATGQVVGRYLTMNDANPTNALWTDAQNIVHFRATFGDTFQNQNQTEISLSRQNGDFYWIGTLISSFPQ